MFPYEKFMYTQKIKNEEPCESSIKRYKTDS